jgi:hypothetical protein
MTTMFVGDAIASTDFVSANVDDEATILDLQTMLANRVTCLMVSLSSKVSSEVGLNLHPELPSIHPVFAIPSTNGGNHTPAFADAARTPEAHKACMTVTKGLAMTGFRLLDDDAFFKRVSPMCIRNICN